MKLTFTMTKLNTVAGITASFQKMVKDLEHLVASNHEDIDAANKVRTEAAFAIRDAQAEIDKAQKVMNNIAALIEE